MEPKEIYVVESGAVTKRVIGALVPLPQPADAPAVPDGAVTLYPIATFEVLSGSEFAAFQPRFTGTAMVWVFPGAAGVLSCRARTIGGASVDVTGPLKQGAQLAASQPATAAVPIQADVVYTLEYSVNCTMTAMVTGTTRVVADPPAGVTVLGRKTLLTQVANGVSVPANSWWTHTGYIDVDGYDKVVGSYKWETSVLSRMELNFSPDGAANGGMAVATSITVAFGSTESGVYLPYVQGTVQNGDTSNAHTLSAWIYTRS